MPKITKTILLMKTWFMTMDTTPHGIIILVVNPDLSTKEYGWLRETAGAQAAQHNLCTMLLLELLLSTSILIRRMESG